MKKDPKLQNVSSKGETMKPVHYVLIGVLTGLLAGGILWASASNPSGEPVALLPTSTPGMLVVYVSGAVADPGVYSLPDGSRVEAAILAAGGFVPGAEEERINLAMPLVDGQQVDVPGIIQSDHVNAGRVNLNTATVSELDALPGIGPTTAQAIVDYRLQNGNFQSIQQVQNVSGVGPATFERIQDYITVGP
jgi:competence protein ComEA